MKKMYHDNVSIDCRCNILGIDQTETRSMDDLPRLGYRKGSEPDTNTNTIPSLTSTRKLSISHMKRKLTPAKNRINSQKQLDCLKFTTCDDTYKTLNTDSISVQLPQKSKLTFSTQTSNKNNLIADKKTNYMVLQKKYSVQTQLHPTPPIIPLRKVESMMTRPKPMPRRQVQINIPNYKPLINQQNYSNIHTTFPIQHLNLPEQGGLKFQTTKAWKHQPKTSQAVSPKYVQLSAQDKFNQFKIAISSNPTVRLPKQSIVQSVFENTQSVLSKKTQTNRFRIAHSQNETDTITIDDNNQSVVIQRFLEREKFPRGTFTQGEAKYLQIPVRSALMKSPLKNSASSQKELQAPFDFIT